MKQGSNHGKNKEKKEKFDKEKRTVKIKLQKKICLAFDGKLDIAAQRLALSIINPNSPTCESH